MDYILFVPFNSAGFIPKPLFSKNEGLCRNIQNCNILITFIAQVIHQHRSTSTHINNWGIMSNPRVTDKLQ